MKITIKELLKQYGKKDLVAIILKDKSHIYSVSFSSKEGSTQRRETSGK